MSTTEESEVTTEAADADTDLLPTGTVVQAEPAVEELPEGGLTTEAASEMLPSGDDLAAEFEAFLREQDRPSGGSDPS